MLSILLGHGWRSANTSACFLTEIHLERMRGAACRMIAAARRAGSRVIVAVCDATHEPAANSSGIRRIHGAG
jgi:hypothetical protein